MSLRSLFPGGRSEIHVSHPCSPSLRNRDLEKFREVLRITLGGCQRWDLEEISVGGGRRGDELEIGVWRITTREWKLQSPYKALQLSKNAQVQNVKYFSATPPWVQFSCLMMAVSPKSSLRFELVYSCSIKVFYTRFAIFIFLSQKCVVRLKSQFNKKYYHPLPRRLNLGKYEEIWGEYEGIWGNNENMKEYEDTFTGSFSGSKSCGRPTTFLNIAHNFRHFFKIP